MTRTPGRTPTGSGRGGARRSEGKRQASAVGRSALEGISKNDIKRLARRAGVKRMSHQIYDAAVPGSAPQVLRAWLHKMVSKLVTVAEFARRSTVITNDVAFVLKREGITVYGKGMDWTYGCYSRQQIKARICRKLSQEALHAAAEARALSEAGSCGQDRSGGGAPLPAVPEQPAAPQQGDAGPAVSTPSVAASAPRGGQLETDAAELEQAHAAVGVAGTPQQAQQAQQAPEQILQRVQQAQEVQVQALQATTPAAAARAGGKGSPAASASVAQERRLSDVPTPPIQPVSMERATEVQALLAEVWPCLQRDGCVSRRELKRVMLAKHGCTAAEVQDVLFALERQDSIMCDGAAPDDLYFCC